MATASSLSKQGLWLCCRSLQVGCGDFVQCGWWASPVMREICSLLASQVTPEEWKRARPLIHLPLHQPAELAGCTRGMVQSACPNLCAGDLHAGFCLRGHSPSSPPPEPVWLHTIPQRPWAHLCTAATGTPTKRILQPRSATSNPTCTHQPGAKETWAGGEMWDTTQGNALRLSLSIAAAKPSGRPELSEHSSTHP